MPDARLPSRWQTDPDRLGLSDAAWRIHSWALMWSSEQWTDGRIPTAAVRMFPIDDGANRAASIEELVTAKLWRITKAGWQIADWAKTQTTAEANERRLAQYRESARKRRSKSGESPREVEAVSRSDPSPDAELSTEESTWTSEEEEKAEEKDEVEVKDVDSRTGEVRDLTPYRWETVDGRRMKVPA